MGSSIRRSAALLLLALPSAVGAQGANRTVRLVGEVVDSVSGRPVSGVLLEVRGLGVVTLTDSVGHFAVEVPMQDGYRVTVQQLGYRPRLLILPATVTTRPLVLTMSPDPLVLRGLDIVVAEQGVHRVLREQETRRRGYAGSVRLIHRERLARSAAASARDELMSHMPNAVECNVGGRGSLCLAGLRRRAIKVCIDGVRALGGAADLRMYNPSELYSVEIYNRGSLVLVYTNRYMERAMTHRVFVQPFPERVC
jgi:Carboxypeptidase regulatory-like domain/TonB-dependent Receptor Plug Domain